MGGEWEGWGAAPVQAFVDQISQRQRSAHVNTPARGIRPRAAWRRWLRDPEVGAMMGPGAIRTALQHAYNNDIAMLHVHRHEHTGRPWFSPLDLRESAKFVPDFWKVRPGAPHGTLVLSRDSMSGLCWHSVSRRPEPIDQLTVIGRPMGIFGRWWQ